VIGENPGSDSVLSGFPIPVAELSAVPVPVAWVCHRGNPGSDGALPGVPIPVAWVCHRGGIPALGVCVVGGSYSGDGGRSAGKFRLRRRGLSEV